jgi:hypothetical protein
MLRSIQVLMTEFNVGTFTLWSSFAFGCVFMTTQPMPQVFTALYAWTEWQAGMFQISLFIGEIIWLCACLTQDNLIYPHFTTTKSNSEARLYTAISASILGLTGSFFLYACFSYSTVGWIVLSLGLAFIGLSIT